MKMIRRSRRALLLLLFGYAVLALVAGCRSWIPVPTGETVRSQNRERLNQLSVGMGKTQILKIMGTESIQTYKKSALPSKRTSNTISDAVRARYRSERIDNPFRTEMSHTADGANVEILFYYTDTQKVDGAITDDELTPIVIESGFLAGWGWIFLQQNFGKYHIEPRRR